MRPAQVLEQRLAQGSLALPPLPAVAQRVLALAGDESASSAALAGLVHRDAGLAASVLRCANSAAARGVAPIASLQQAVTRLGMAEVSRIAFAASMRQGIFASGAYAGAVEQLWRRSLATGLFAKEVARSLRLNVEVAFLCGLLWRVGQPLALNGLTQVLPEEERPSEAEALALARELDEAFTASAAECWELPASVGDALRAREAETEAGPECRMARVAECLADAALAEKDADADFELAPGRDSAELNLYPDQLEGLLARAAEIRSELTELP